MCLMTTLKDCVRRFCEVLSSQWLEQARNWTCQKWLWKVLRKRLCFYPYKMRLVQALTPADKVKSCDFCEEMQLKMEENYFVDILIFCDEATFHISGKVNIHNVRILGTEQAHAQIDQQRDSKSQRFLCGVPRESDRPFFLHWSNCDWRLISRHFGKLVVTPNEHQLWRLHSTTGWCSPHFHRNVQVLLNRVLQQRWIGHAAKGDNTPFAGSNTMRFLSLGVR